MRRTGLAGLGLAGLGLAFCLGAAIGPLRASEGRPHSAQDQDAARQAVQRGEIRPLAEVLDAVAARIPGEIVSVELERHDGRWIYELKLINGNGRRRKLEIDARTLQTIEDD